MKQYPPDSDRKVADILDNLRDLYERPSMYSAVNTKEIIWDAMELIRIMHIDMIGWETNESY